MTSADVHSVYIHTIYSSTVPSAVLASGTESLDYNSTVSLDCNGTVSLLIYTMSPSKLDPGLLVHVWVLWFVLVSTVLSEAVKWKTSGINCNSVSVPFVTDAITHLPSVPWHCWLGVRKSIRLVKSWVMRCWCGYLSGARSRHMVRLMPLPSQNPVISCLT